MSGKSWKDLVYKLGLSDGGTTGFCKEIFRQTTNDKLVEQRISSHWII